MSAHFLVLVSGLENNSLANPLLDQIKGILTTNQILILSERLLSPDKAVEIEIQKNIATDLFRQLQNICDSYKTDIFITAKESRRKRLLLADMDATIIEGETLDDLAEIVGLKEKISAITTRAMRGEIDFKAALIERVSMLEGLSLSDLHRTLSASKINAGAEDVIRVMRNFGAYCYLVSGGFTYFTGAVSEAIGFNGHHGNILEIKNGHLTGNVIPPILDKDSKLSFLHHYTETLSLHPSETMAIGDGANDIPMLLGAGLGVGYHPKPSVREKIMNIIVHTDLTSLLYIQGYTWQEIADSTLSNNKIPVT